MKRITRHLHRRLNALRAPMGVPLLALALAGIVNAQSNTKTGVNAGNSITTGVSNTADGAAALRFTTTGSYNTAVGESALLSNLSGQQNVALGSFSLRVNTASFNTGVGHGSLYSNTGGSLNVGLGNSSLRFNTSGSSNVAAGYQALYSNTTGGFNTALGDGALLNNTTGIGNIALGDDAGINLTVGSNNISIGNKAFAGESGIIRIGTPDVHTHTYLTGIIHGNGAGLTGVPASTLSGTIIGDQIAFNTITGNQIASATLTANTFLTSGTRTAGKVLGFDGASLTWTDPAGAGSLTHNATLSGSGTAASPLGVSVPLVVQDTSNTGYGIIGTGLSGIFGAAHSASGFGVYGYDGSPTITAVGVYGDSDRGTAVYGKSLNGTAGLFAGPMVVVDGGIAQVEVTGTYGIRSGYFGASPTPGNGGELRLQGSWTRSTGGRIRLGGSERGDADRNVVQFLQNNLERMRINDGGNVGIGTTNPQATLEVNGTARVKVLTILGADVAEPFDIAEENLPKGTVVSIDTRRLGGLQRSTSEYDTCVAGIVSGAKGINSGLILSQPGVNEGGQNVAISGRVYVQADASSGPIRPGDLLTTSDNPGHAMKATDHSRSQGAVLGKAMSALDEGEGMVLVLVTLQ